MLYGVNTKERDRGGVLADKNRYSPWSGAPMSGRLDCRVGEDALALFRATRRQAAPMTFRPSTPAPPTRSPASPGPTAARRSWASAGRSMPAAPLSARAA